MLYIKNVSTNIKKIKICDENKIVVLPLQKYNKIIIIY